MCPHCFATNIGSFGKRFVLFVFVLMVCFSDWANLLSQSSESEGEIMMCFSLSDTSALGDKCLVEEEQ